MTRHKFNKKKLLLSIIVLFIIAFFLIWLYNDYRNSYSKFILYKPDGYGEFKPFINFKDYNSVKLEKLFRENNIEFKKEKDVYLIKNKDLQFKDLMYTIADQYFREEKI